MLILFSCQGTDIRRRAANLPDPPVRVKRNVSVFTNASRLIRTAWKEPPPAGTEELSCHAPRCQPHHPGNVHNFDMPRGISDFAPFSPQSATFASQSAGAGARTPHNGTSGKPIPRLPASVSGWPGLPKLQCRRELLLPFRDQAPCRDPA